MKANYSKQPAAFELHPDGKNRTRILLREHITSHEQQGDDGTETVWEADEYSVSAFSRPGLARDVEANFEMFLADAKAAEAKAKADEERAELERSVAADLVDTLLETDYRLMMLEEFSVI